ncbi:MAG: PAS domain S-box protein [Dehalococcoidales bacterium]|nr:PAS domain S-box protein [Dehalococcoidales bacterium]
MTEKPDNGIQSDSDEFFRSVYENANDAIFLMDGDVFIDCNRKTREMFGCGIEEILTRHPYDFSPSEQPDGCDSREKAKRYIDAVLSGIPQFFEWKHRKLDGTLFDAEVSLTRLERNGKLVVLAMVRDITGRKQTEEALKHAYEELEERVEQRTAELKKANTMLKDEIEKRRKTQEALGESDIRYRNFLESFNGIVLEMDSDGTITSMNRFGRRFFGFNKREILEKNVVGTIVPAVGTAGEDLRQMIRNILQSPEQYFSNENENIRKNGERVWIAWTNRVIFNPEKNRAEILCIGVDRTEQKLAQERLALEIEERAAAGERNRLARELHDAVSQTLFSSSLIAEVLPRIWERDEDEGRKRLEEVRLLSKSALAEMRTLLFELRPAALEEADPAELLRHLSDTVSGRYQVSVKLNITGEISLPANVKLTFYRIAQQALNNITKHAEATEIEITLLGDKTSVVMSINDNGKGFDTSNTLPENMGLVIMKERAEGIGAGLEIKSELTKGTRIGVTWNRDTSEVE